MDSVLTLDKDGFSESRPGNKWPKGGFKSEETGGFLLRQNKYSKSLFWAENLNFPPKTVNNLFKFSAQDSPGFGIFILEK